MKHGQHCSDSRYDLPACGDPDGHAAWLASQEPDLWLVAGGGSETPFTGRDGRRYLYVWNPAREEHGYLDLGTDLESSPPRFATLSCRVVNEFEFDRIGN
jgi:hypothetical protein